MTGNFVVFLIASVTVYFFLMYGYPYVRRRMRGKDVVYIEPQALEKRMSEKKDMLMVDLRSSVEFYGMFGHIDGAINLPFEAFMVRIAETADRLAGFKETPVVLIGLRDENEVFKAYTTLNLRERQFPSKRCKFATHGRPHRSCEPYPKQAKQLSAPP